MRSLLVEPFTAPFMVRALTEMLLLAVLSGVVSAFVLTRRLGFVADTMTHTVFPGVVAGYLAAGVAGVFPGALAAGILTAVLLTLFTRSRRVSEDTALAVLLVSMFSVGVVLVSRRSSYTSDLTAFLFGRLLTVSAGQVLRTAVVAALVLASLAALYKELQLRAFDPTAAAAMGYRVAVLDLALNTAIALVVVAAAQAVGTILVIALLIVPAAAGRLLSDRMWMIMVAGVVVAGLAGYLGLAVSYTASVVYGLRLASGATVVLWLVTLYLLALASVPARRWVASRTPPGEAPVELV
jgi:manganese/iron transport system permease protein